MADNVTPLPDVPAAPVTEPVAPVAETAFTGPVERIVIEVTPRGTPDTPLAGPTPVDPGALRFETTLSNLAERVDSERQIFTLEPSQLLPLKDVPEPTDAARALPGSLTTEGTRTGLRAEAPAVPPSPAEQFAKDAPVQAVAGGLDAVRSTLGGVEDLTETFLGSPLFEMSQYVPMLPKSQSAGANLVRGLSQFATAFVPLTAAAKVLGATGTVANLTTGALADFFAQDPSDQRLTDLVVGAAPGLVDTPVIGAVLSYLRSDEGDTRAESRLKNVVEGALLGVGVGAVFNPKATADQVVEVAKQIKTVRAAGLLNNQRGAIGGGGGKFGKGGGTPKKPADPAKASQMSIDKGRADFLRYKPTSLKETADAFENNVAHQRRVGLTEGVRPDEQLLAEANIAGKLTPEQVRAIVPGTNLDDTTSLRLGFALEQQMRDAKVLAEQVIAKHGDHDAADALAEQIRTMAVTLTAAKGVAAEAGRSERVFGFAEMSALMAQTEGIVKNAKADSVGMFALANHIRNLKDPAEIAKALDVAGKQYGAGRKILNMVVEMMVSNALTAPSSMIVNATGNSAMLAAQIPIRMAAAIIDRGKHIPPSEAGSLAYGMLEAVGSSWKQFAKGFRNLRAGVDDLGNATEFGNAAGAFTQEATGLNGVFGYITELFGSAITAGHVGGRVLNGSDLAARAIARSGQRRALANRLAYEEAIASGATGASFRQYHKTRFQQLLTDLPESAAQEAELFAKYIALQDDITNKHLKGYAQLLNQNPSLRFVNLFFRTPTNSVHRIFEFTPGLNHLSTRVQTELAAGGARASIQKAKTALGAASIATLMGAYGAGKLTGAKPRDEQLIEAYNSSGRQENSVVLSEYEDGSPAIQVSYKRLGEPFSTFIELVTETTQIMGLAIQVAQDGDTEMLPLLGEVSRSLAEMVGEVLINNSFIGDWAEFLSFVAHPARHGTGTAKEIGALLVPFSAARNDLRKQFDPTLKEAKTVLDYLKSRDPWYSKDVKSQRNLFGEKVLIPEGLGDVFAPEWAIGNFVVTVSQYSLPGATR